MSNRREKKSMDNSEDDTKMKKTSTRGRGRGRGRRAKGGSKRCNVKTIKTVVKEEPNEEEDEELENSCSNPIALDLVKLDKADDVDFESLSFVGTTTSRINMPLRGNEALCWKNKVTLIGEKCPNPRIHLCDKCKSPILIYGRMIPCKHVFCYSCGLLNDGNCFTCKDRVVRTEKNKLGSVYMCEVEACKRTYLSERDLSAHVNHRHITRKSVNNANPGQSVSNNSLQSSSITSQSHNRSLSYNAVHNIGNESFQSPIPVVSTRSNLITVPIQNEVSMGLSSMPNMGGQQPPMSHYGSQQFRGNQMQWMNAFPIPTYPPNGRVPNHPWPVNIPGQQSSHQSSFNRPYYP